MFTGREEVLKAVRQAFLAGGRSAVQALNGIGGVGKTQIAAEYVHRFADTYPVVWWISADQDGLLGRQFAALADALGCTKPGAGPELARTTVMSTLRERGGWLLIFDNAEDPEHIAGWLPGGSGHVLITSRARRWGEIAVPVEVDVLPRKESVAILQARVPSLGAEQAVQVADTLGDLPLALTQAAGSMADMGRSAEEYLSLLGSQVAQLMDEGRPLSYPQSLAAVTQVAFHRLRTDMPAAAELVTICAFLAPEPVVGHWFLRAADLLHTPLREVAANPIEWPIVIAKVGLCALARIDHRGLQMHRMTHAILRGDSHGTQASTIRDLARTVLAANHPGDPRSPDTWPAWAQLIPHLLVLDPALGINTSQRDLACDAARYLIYRGDAHGCHDLAEVLYQEWKKQSGPDDHQTLSAAIVLGNALRGISHYQAARDLDADTLARYRRVLGDDHPETLRTANNLAVDLWELGNFKAARAMHEDALARYRRVLGNDHPETLRTANNLAVDLIKLGNWRSARKLLEDTSAQRRQILGDDHPDTLNSATNLSIVMFRLGHWRAVSKLDKDTLARYRRVLGDDHPNTLLAANNVAFDLFFLGRWRAAWRLHKDTLARRSRILGGNHGIASGKTAAHGHHS